MTPPIPPPELDALVAHHLPWYREARERFPAWTYHRPRWQGVPWVDRLRWSAMLPVRAVEAEIQVLHQKRGSGWLALLETPVGPVRYGRLGETEEGLVLELLSVREELPPRWKARVLAAFAVTGADPPEAPGEIQVPEEWGTMPFDSADLEELRTSLITTLLLRTRWDTPSLFDRFVEVARVEQEPGTEVTEERDALSRELALGTGLLLPKRPGGRWHIKDRPELHRALNEEAAELVQVVRAFDPDEEVLELVSKLNQRDREERPHILDSPAVVKSQEVDARGRGPLALLMRFPFLGWGELDSIVTRDVGRKEMAYKLVAARAAAPISGDTVRRYLR